MKTYPEGSVLYYLTLEGASGGKADVASGRYDRAHLPRKWGNFMKALSVFLPISSYSMLLDKSLYSKRTEKREGDYTYCDVSYEEGGSPYCYLCDIDEVHPGIMYASRSALTIMKSPRASRMSTTEPKKTRRIRSTV